MALVTRCRRYAYWVLLFGIAAPAQSGDDPQALLQQVRWRVMDTVERLPKYVCTQTIERTRYEADASRARARSCDDIAATVNRGGWKRRLASSDRLRLDVAVSQGRPGTVNEMYSWAGENRFSDRSLFEMVTEGAVSTGSFSSILAAIFGGQSATFSYNGDGMAGGRLLSEFGFGVARERSQSAYIWGKERGQQTAIAFGGTFLVDPETSDLVRLVIRTDEMPAQTGACALTQTLDYGRVHLNDADFLLPAEARFQVIHRDETQAENHIHFSACQEFRGESTVRFDKPEETAPAGNHSPKGAVHLPAGLPFKLAFTERIDPSVAAAGDPIRARLVTAIRDQASKAILVPEGTPVGGRIVSVRRFYDPPKQQKTTSPSLVLSVRLETLEMGGASYPFRAGLDSGLRRFAKSADLLSMHIDLGSPDRPEDPDIGVFEFRNANPDYVIESGLGSNWVTLAVH